MIAKKIIFKGRVQGVGFRYTSYSIAKTYEKNGLSGWVKNLANGDVEFFVQVKEIDIQNCLDAIAQSRLGKLIENKKVEEKKFSDKVKGFTIIY